MIWALLTSCVRPECTPTNFTLSECRAIAEHDFARLKTTDGVEVRFQDGDSGVEGWEAMGVVSLADDGGIHARVAGLGAFRLTIHRGDSGVDVLPLSLHNVHPAVPPLDGELSRSGLTRELQVVLDDDVVEVKGGLPASACETGFTVVAVGDVQTNPRQFQRIIDSLHAEAERGAALGQPLAGLILLGDAAEFGLREELDAVDGILRSSPVPTALVPGNHDVYDAHDAVYNAVFGPGNYAFDVCDLHMAMFDTGSGDMARSVQGRLPELLDTDQRFLISASHHPPYAARSAIGWTREDQAHLLMAELAARDADLMLAGHAHRRIAHDQPPVRQEVVGTGGASQYAIDPDYGYLRLTFTDEMETCFVPVAAPGSEEPIKAGQPETCPTSTLP